VKVFGDTVPFIALLSTRDRWHTRAVALRRQPPGPLVTTEWVLTEVGDAFSQPGARQKFSRLSGLLRAQPDVEIVPATGDLFRRGTELSAARPDREWSLTDCISFVVMDERGISDALTSDHHFEQAGFRILLKNLEWQLRKGF
jgi:predicted nucleic acid-binding protein